MRLKRCYFDYAASTPVDPRVLEAMMPYFTEKYGNPGSLHSFGQEAINVVDLSRERVAKAIGRPPAGGFQEIIFTGSATEANNLVLRGVVARQRIANQLRMNEFVNSGKIRNSLMVPRVIVSSIEHESILETARDLEGDGVEVIYLPVSKDGVVNLEALKSALNENTVLVSIMYANNEIGTVQPIAEISEIIRNFRERSGPISSTITTTRSIYPLFHTDAVQAFQFLNCKPEDLGIDLMTLSAHKIYGPKGIGMLYARGFMVSGIGSSEKNKTLNSSAESGSASGGNSYTLTPILTGGGQEFGLRSGTENVPNIVGFSKAVELAVESRESVSQNIRALRDQLLDGLRKIFPDIELNSNHSNILPNILNIYFPKYLSEDLIAKLDLFGIAVSAGSACKARAITPSYVVKALGYDTERSKRSLRFSLGRRTTKEEINLCLEAMAEIKIS
jgi:cysteine desulfurase